MSISSISMPAVRPVVKLAAQARPAAIAPAAAAPKQSQPVKAQTQPKKHSLFGLIAGIGTGVSALGGAALGLFACGMSDAPVGALETLKSAGTGGVVGAVIGAVAFFGGGSIIRKIFGK